MADEDDDDIDDVEIRDYDAKLHVGGLEVASVAERVPPELLAVFTDEMHRTRTATKAAHPPKIEPGNIVYEFVSAGRVIADRLDILGFTPRRVLQTIDEALDEARDMADRIDQYMPDEAMVTHDAKRSLLTDLTAAEWIDKLGGMCPWQSFNGDSWAGRRRLAYVALRTEPGSVYGLLTGCD